MTLRATYSLRERQKHKAVSISGFMGFQENGINPYIWCVVGAVLGWIASLLSGKSGERIVIIENVGVGIFGAYIGGDFVVNMVNGPAKDAEFHMASLGFAVAGAVVMLYLLRLLQSRMGVMRTTKKRKRN